MKTPKAAATLHNSSVAKTTKSPTFHNSCGVASNFRIMTDIRNKILSLRHLLDLSPCDGSESDAFEEDIEDDQATERSPSPDAFERHFSESYSSNNTSLSSSPTSILPKIITNASKKNAKASIATPLRLSLKVQAVGKKNPIKVKHLENLSENSGIYWTGASNGQPVQARVTLDVLLPPSSISKLQSKVTEQAAVSPSPYVLSPKIIQPQGPTTPAPDSTPSPKSEESTPSSPAAQPTTSGNSVTPPPPPPPPAITSKNRAVPPPPLPPPRKSEIVHSSPPPLSPHKALRGMVTSHPLPPRASNGATPAPPSPKPIGKVAAPPPPPMPMGKRATPPPSPPPPMPMKKGGALPPPPPVFAGAKNPRLNKAATKLKRSSQMGNLYRSLKGKVEGSSLDRKSKGGKGKFSAASKGGKPGMADALAEITRRSAYFQQIEEDVKNHAKKVMEMKKAIASFHTSDMSELIRFHKYVELHLEKLTDESQVLARFEDFPFKKLEALRTAATLYSKLDSIICTLQSWQPASPVSQHLARAERYFNKIKGDLDSLERTKDEESKKLKTHKIHFDFSILERIKELMVDVSSNCMELAIKEKREATAKEKDAAATINEGCKKDSAQLLWKAFQFAFRVYTFAGGHDERAERLTKELAEEIETGLHR